MRTIMSSASALALTIGIIPGVAAAQTGGAAETQGQGQAQAPARRGSTIIVTATRRSEDLQDVPVAVQAIGTEQLEELNIGTFDDYLTQLPNVTAGGGGPGQSTIYIRGLASTTPNLTTAGVAGLAPNVALYLDDQPLSQPGRNLDVYAADLERIEVLSGPQGTLFGASSQAGTVRLITNKPDLSGLSAKVSGGVSFTKGGEMSHKLEGVLNVPVTDTLAIRGVVYLDNQGGYIDNVPGTRDTSASARFRPAGTVRDNGVPVSAQRAGFQAGDDLSNVNFLTADNSGLVEEDFNDTQYSGFRISALWEFAPDWSLNIAHARQDLDSDGVFFQDPDLDDLEIQRFEQDRLEDQFSNTSWTVEGRLGFLDVIYTGAYTERETDQRVDYSDYLFVGQYLPYYICDGSVSYPGAAGPTGTCQAPNLFVNSRTETDVFTQELRLSTPAEERISAQGGVFYSDLTLTERNDFTYPGSTQVQGFSPGVVGFAPNFPFTTGFTSDPGPFPAGVIFRNDVRRTDEQYGIFGEVTGEIVPDTLAITVGARYYDVKVDLEGSANASFCNLTGANGTDVNGFGTDISDIYNGDGQITFRGTCDPNAQITYNEGNVDANTPAQVIAALNAPDAAETDGFIFKGTIEFTPTEDLLFYATYSEGFRPGLLNRPGGAQGPGGFTVPFALDTDDVTNWEVGMKTSLFGQQLRFNASAFFVQVDRLQTTIFDPSITNLFFSDNAANAEIYGIEGDFTWQPYSVEGLTVAGAFSVLDTEITDVLTPTNDVQVGRELAFAPSFQGNLRARYEWDIGESKDITLHVQPQIAYSASSFTDIIDINRLQLDSWFTAGLAVGMAKDDWTFEIFGENLTDERAEISGSFVFDRARVVVNRPLTVGARFSFTY